MRRSFSPPPGAAAAMAFYLLLMVCATCARTEGLRLEPGVYTGNGTGVRLLAQSPKLGPLSLFTENTRGSVSKPGGSGYVYETTLYLSTDLPWALELRAGVREAGYRLGAPGYWEKRNDSLAAQILKKGRGWSLRAAWKGKASTPHNELAGSYEARGTATMYRLWRGSPMWLRPFIVGCEYKQYFWRQSGRTGEDSTVRVDVSYPLQTRWGR